MCLNKARFVNANICSLKCARLYFDFINKCYLYACIFTLQYTVRKDVTRPHRTAGTN